MKNIYKIFGAAAIIGLFLISSIPSTSLAAIGQSQGMQVVQSDELQQQQQDEEEIDFDDDQYPLDNYGWLGETLPYPQSTPFWGNGDLAVTFATRAITQPAQQRGKVYVKVRNVGLSTSLGGEIQIKVRHTLAGIPTDLVYQSSWINIPTTTAGRARRIITPIIGTISMDELLYYFRAEIESDSPEGPIRGHNVRHGYFVGAIFGGVVSEEMGCVQSLPLR